MKASKNGLSLTIIFAMILSNVIDIKESQACPGAVGVGNMGTRSQGYNRYLGVRRSLQLSGISLSIQIFIDNIQFYFHFFV